MSEIRPGDDYLVSALAAGGQIRAFAATTKNLVEEARQRHNTSPVASAALGRLLTAGAMMGCMMKGDEDLLTLKIDADGPIAGLTVTADSHGTVKGYPGNPTVLIHAKPNGKLDVSGAVGAGTLTVIRDLGLKEPYSGQIELISGEIAEDITYCFAVSEQTPSSVGLGVLLNKENTIRQAGGFILQLMPDAAEETIAALEEKLKGVASVTEMLDGGMAPEDILYRFLGDMDLEITEKRPLAFRCNCSREKVRRAVGSVGMKSLREMIADGKDIEVKCHFCNTAYTFTPDDLKAMVMERLQKLKIME